MKPEKVVLRIYWTGQLVDATVLRSWWFMRLVRWEINERKCARYFNEKLDGS